MTPELVTPDAVAASLDARHVLPRAVTLWPQRDLMRQLFRVLGDDQDAVCLAYVGAERDGRIARPPGAEGMAPGVHARALWWEGRLRGWLRS